MGPLFQTLGLSAALSLAACSAPSGFPELDCTHRDVQVDGSSLVGIEDMAALIDGTLILSAYNRRDRDASPKGLFTLTPPRDDSPWGAKRVTAEGDALIPHGISLSPDETALYVVDRSPERSPSILRFNLQDSSQNSVTKDIVVSHDSWPRSLPYPCNLNDVLAEDDGTLTFTNDRASCSWLGKAVDNVFGRANGSLWSLSSDGGISLLAGGLEFPNGLAQSSDTIVVAQTRGQSIYDMESGTIQTLTGSPDNMTKSANGEIWVAALPSLIRYALFRAGMIENAGGSLITRLSPTVATYNIPEHSGATTALRVAETLYISGAYTTGILTCAVPDA